MNKYECTISIELNPVRYANSEEEFIKNLIKEYNNKCHKLFEIDRNDITQITSDEEDEGEA